MTVYGLPEVPAQVCVVVATPEVTGTVLGDVPSPKSKVTVPVGVPPPGAAAERVAVTVTGWPVTAGSGSEVTTVMDAPRPTDWVVAPLEAVKSVSPP
ncbi:hypothetical protein BG653_05639 [Streptomyces platensis]|uniref:Uncharacterized protein n=1 Tax=Streptomyces platensis TaxID=58346 RepID=A0ABX3XQ87_STRPT|nr:hypothetical protein BG653_05639 [Streptomyces platensis]